ncbi:MAG: FHA domain-containing protein [Planctomycetota bacterium]|jgi:pSer/pThr/pTyr-binding forkhead associated (FHA) protein
MLQLRVAGSDKTYPLTKKTVVGSESSADIHLEGEEIKPTHCILTAAGSRVMLMVLDPSAVVEVNGEKALQKALKAGDVLTIGGAELTLEEVEEAGKGSGDPPPLGGATLPPADAPPPGMPHPATAQAPVALVLKQGPGAGREFPIDPEAGKVTIGRDPSSVIALEDPRVSANHGTLERGEGGWVFSDVGSSGGSRVNGIKVKSIPVSDGDELELGDSVLVLRVKTAAAAEEPEDGEPAKVEAIGKIDEGAIREADAPAIGESADAAKAPPIGGDDAGAKAPVIDAAADDSAATPLPGGDLAGAMQSAPKGLRLEITKGPDAGKEFALRDGVLKVGRAPDNDIVIGEQSVSGKHGEIRVDGSTVTFTDTNSSAGSKVNGIKIDSLALEPGDELSLGTEVVLVLRAPALAGPSDVAGDDAAATPLPGEPAPAAPVPAPVPESAAAPAGPTLAIVKGPGKNTEVVLAKELSTVGRAPTNDIVIDEPSVSGSHGEFRWIDGKLEFRDTGSSAGSKINGIKVDSLGLEEGDEVQLGTVSLLRVVSLGVPSAVAPSAPPAPAEPAPEPQALSPAEAAAAFDLPKRGAGGAYTLVGTSPGIDGKIFNLGGTAVIGSDPASQIHVPPETGVAPKHAEVFETLTGPAIRRLEGAPEVLVQGVPIELLPLAHGDVIGLGQAQLIVRGSGKGVVKGGGAAPKSSATDLLTTRYRVVVKSGAHAGSEFKLVGLTRVGRDPRCDVVLTDPTVSANHCEIAPVAGGWTVRDVGSSAGTMVGDLKATGDLAVKHGVVIKCGDVELRFEDTEAEIELAAAQPVPAATPAKPEPVKLTGVRRRPRGAEPTAHARALLVVSGTERGVRWEFADKVTLGRLESNDIALDNPEVSGEHAWLRLHDGGILLEDRGSTNGTRVNDEPIHTKLLQHGDVIEVQDFEFMYLEPDQPVPELDRYSRPSLIKLGDANKRLGRWRIPLTLTIGRASVHNVVLADDTEVSGDHCKIVDRSGHFYLIDTSTNGTRVNGKKVKNEVRLHHSDVILVGASKFAFKDAHKSLEVQELRGSQIGVMLAALLVLVLGIGGIGYFVVYSDTGGKRERPNLLTVNWDFSQAEAGGAIPGWRFQFDRDSGLSAAVAAAGGGGFLEVKAGGGTVGPTSNFEAIYDAPLPYERLNAYQLRGRVKAQGAETGGAAMRLRFHLKDGSVWDRYSHWVADTNDIYQDLTLTVRPPKGAERIEVAAVTRGRAGIVRFDDVKLHAIPLSDKEAKDLPNSAKVTSTDRFGTLTAEINTQGVVALKRGDDRVFAEVFFQLRGMPGLGARALPRVDQLMSYTETMTSTPDGVLVELTGFDFATGQRVRYSINVRPSTGATGDAKGGLKIAAEFDGLTPHTSAGKVEAVVYFRGAAGREGRWENRRRTADGDLNESSNDFPAEIGVTHWIIGAQAGQTALAFTPEAVVLGRYVEATKAVDGVAQLSSDFTGGGLSLAIATVGPGTAEEYQLHRQNITRAQEVEDGSVSPEYEAHKGFAKAFAWLTAEASVSKQRMTAIEAELQRDLEPLRDRCVELAEALEQAAESGVEPTPEQQAAFGEQITLLGEFRTKYGVIPGASEADALETRLKTAMDNAGVGAKRKIVVAILEEARAAHAAGNLLKARILLEGLTVYQTKLLGQVKERDAVYKLLTELDAARDDASARDKAFATAKRAAALAEARGDKAGAVEAWRAFLRQYPDQVGGNLKLSEKAKQAIQAIWNLTHPK